MIEKRICKVFSFYRGLLLVNLFSMSFEKKLSVFSKIRKSSFSRMIFILTKRITAAIEKTGAAVTHCPNLEQAENALNDLSFEAALFDLNLPDGKAWTFSAENWSPITP